ncbi:Uncharacterized protein GBIM_20254 [Gryllus bimaculatus]|nr:Uncharacterized protein GBIM_20254 [Gryllus bimaculatus]
MRFVHQSSSPELSLLFTDFMVIINLSVYPIRSTRLTSPCEDGYMYVPVAFLAMLYLLYLVECWHCTAGGGAGAALGWGGAGGGGGGGGGPGDGVVDRACLLQRVQEMREAQPHVWWKAVCYHYVRRKRQVTRYRHGDAYTSTQVFYERVNSHAAGSFFMYAFCGVRDASPRLVLDKAGPITKVRFSKGEPSPRCASHRHQGPLLTITKVRFFKTEL